MKLLTINQGPESWQANLTFAYDPVIVAQVKAMPGFKWQNRSWVGPKEAVDILCSDLARLNLAKVINKLDTYPQIAGLPHAPFHPELFPYQKEGAAWVRFMLLEEQACLLADGMGLGKSAQAICGVESCSAGPYLIICPAVVKTHWARELNRWSISPSSWHVFGYEQFVKQWQKNRLDFEPSAIVLDEIHYCSNSRSKRSKVVKELCETFTKAVRLGLSGTPLTTRPRDLHNVLDILHPGRFGSYWQFTKRYCAGAYVSIKGVENPVWQCDGASNLDELGNRLSAVMLRRTKADVAEQLPRRTRVCIDVEMPKRARQNISKAAALLGDIELNAKVQTILSHVEEYKIKAALELANDVLEQGRKVLLLTTRKATARALADTLGGSCVTGDDEPGLRSKVLQSSDLGAATIYSVTTGIDLVHFDCIIFVGLDWVPSTLLQAEARIDRLSQQAENIVIYYLIGLGTFDEIVRMKVIERLTHYEKVLGNEETGLEEGLQSKSDDELFRELCENI